LWHVQAVPWADEREEKLSWLAPSMWDLFGDIYTFRAGVQHISQIDPDATFEV